MKIVFMGTPPAAAVSLAALIGAGHDVAAVYTQPDRPAGRGNKLHASAVKQFALAHNLSVIQPEKLRTAEALSEFRSYAADIAVVVAYGRILPAAFLIAFPHGAINVHFSLLPLYRGAAPVNWAIANGETTTGVTTMKMDEGLDTGDILLQTAVDIGADETAPELMERLSSAGAQLLLQTLEQLDTVAAQPQNHSGASHAPILKRSDGLIDWSQSAFDLARRVRGFQPFPSCYTAFRGKRLTIWKCSARVAEYHSATHPAGSVLAAGQEGFIIKCGEGTELLIGELQLEGKTRVGARDFINGLRPTPGELLGV